MKKINLVPIVSSPPTNVEEEFVDREMSVPFQDIIFYIDWKDSRDFPRAQEWLIETYGPDIKQYDRFVLMGS